MLILAYYTKLCFNLAFRKASPFYKINSAGLSNTGSNWID